MNKIIDDLIACGVPSDTLLAVVKLIAAAEAAEKIRSQTRERMQRFRDRKRNVTSRDVTVTSPTSAYISKKDKKEEREESIDSEPKKVRRVSPKIALPTDFELSESDKQHAIDRGWTAGKIAAELARFCDHACANGRRQADWRAAWRNWVTSPYQTNGGQNGKAYVHAANPHGKTAADVARELFQDCCDEEREFAAWMLPQIGRG